MSRESIAVYRPAEARRVRSQHDWHPPLAPSELVDAIWTASDDPRERDFAWPGRFNGISDLLWINWWVRAFLSKLGSCRRPIWTASGHVEGEHRRLQTR